MIQSIKESLNTFTSRGNLTRRSRLITYISDITIAIIAIVLSAISTSVSGQVFTSIYTLPCDANKYTIIPIPNFFVRQPYTLYAADGTTVLAGPQTSNVFADVTGNIGDSFIVSATSFDNTQYSKLITLNSGTSTINGNVGCVCTLELPFSFCQATFAADSITGASYLWTSPLGFNHYTALGGSFQQPPENGIWTVNTTLVTAGCTHTLSNSFTLSNCKPLPIQYNYINASGSNCKIKIDWSTAYELNCDRFEIEISEDGNSNWRRAITKTAIGSTTTDNIYSVEIDALPTISQFIRIKQIDKDNEFNYSKVFRVNTGCNQSGNKLALFPSSITQNGILHLTFTNNGNKQQGYLYVSNATGKSILTKNIIIDRSVNEFTLPAIGFSKGVYFARLMSTNGSLKCNTVKFVVQ